MEPTTGITKPSRPRFMIAIALPAFLGCASLAFINKNDADYASVLTSHSHEGTTATTPTTISNSGKKFHQSGFGGIYNINHPAGARARRNLAETKVVIPKSANSFAIPSLSEENIMNLHGHYVHDEHRSPFASFLYDRPKEELEAEQKNYEKRMELIRKEWG